MYGQDIFEKWVDTNHEMLGKKFYELELFSLTDTRRILNLLEIAYNAGRESGIDIAINNAIEIGRQKDCADEAWAQGN